MSTKKEDAVSFHVLVKARNSKKMSSVAKETTFSAAEAVFKIKKETAAYENRLFLTRECLGAHTILAKG